MEFVKTSRQLLGWGSLAFGVWGLAEPKSLTGLLGDDPEIGRWLGARDTVVGLALVATGGPLPVALRLASDVHDSVRLCRRSPLVALCAAAFAAWDAAALVAQVNRPRARWPSDAGEHISPAGRRGGLGMAGRM